jgi:hypothetical protein
MFRLFEISSYGPGQVVWPARWATCAYVDDDCAGGSVDGGELSGVESLGGVPGSDDGGDAVFAGHEGGHGAGRR